MSLYFDCAINTGGSSGNIHVNTGWHNSHALLAVGSYSEEKGGYVSLYTDDGEQVENVSIPPHPTAQVTCTAWHPTNKILAIGWENGELFLYSEQTNTCTEVQTLHTANILILEWSQAGSRLVSGDGAGSVVGWSLDRSSQLNTIFHHELKDPLSQLVFRNVLSPEPSLDISGLARAAVAGDERALDLFSSWRPKTGKRGGFGGQNSRENLNFYVGSMSGVIYYLNENGSCMEVLQADGAIRTLLYHDLSDLLIVVTESLVVGQFRVEADGSLVEVSKVKMSSRSADCSITWAGRGLLAITTGELAVRLWNLDTGDNFVLTGNTGAGGHAEFISGLAFGSGKSTLAAGTNLGNIIMWKHQDLVGGEPEDSWVQEPVGRVGMAVKHLSWGTNYNLLVVNSVREVFILREHQISAHYNDNITAVQVSPTKINVYLDDKDEASVLVADIQVRGIFVTAENVVVWNGHRVVVYDILHDSNRFLNQGAFNVECETLVAFEKNVYTLENHKINIRTFQGTIKQSLSLSENEGFGLSLDINSSFLICATLNGCIKMWDLSRREAKSHSHPKYLSEHITNFGEVISAKCNSNATKVSILVAHSNLIPDPKLYIWDVENDVILYFNFSSGKNDQDDSCSVPPNSAQSERSGDSKSKLVSFDICGRVAVSHCWDLEEPRLLLVEAKLVPGTERADIRAQVTCQENTGQTVTVAVSLFVLEDQGIIVHDCTPVAENVVKLLAINVPHYFLLKNPNDESTSLVDKKMLRDFAGLEMTDKKTKEAIVNFSIYLSIGNMDEAFKSIKSIKSEHVWENMAKMCVKTKRLDVAAICLGNMGHAAGARAVRKAIRSKEAPEVQAAILAVHLNMVTEAEQLLLSSGRHDLLNKLYQDSGQWNKALDVCENNDRIHLRNTYYNYGKHLEAMGDLRSSIPMYERSETHRFEVPRMLFDDIQMLESYVMKTEDPAIKRWWAQYMESTGEMETALHFYTVAKDYLSLVRVYCYCDNLEKAAEIASQTGDRSACYHLARQYENIDNIADAIHFFTRAQAYSNAIRICKEQGYDEQMWNLALLAAPGEQLDAARYFETADRPQYDKAVILYEKAGYLGKALELAFSTNQHNALQFISGNLDSNTDPVLLNKTADFFLQGGQFNKAVELYAASKNYPQALELCVNHNISVTEEMAEKLTIPKGQGTEEERLAALDKVAEACFLQGNYHLATKKWTQAGMKQKAMKALLKSGDTEKIVFFANVSREPQIYVLAANYLQSLDWRNSPDIMKHIITFYTKGRAQKLLGGFYQACAQVEIDEYQNYDKALGALTEAYRCLEKDGDQMRIVELQENMADIKVGMWGFTVVMESSRLLYFRIVDFILKLCKHI